LRAEFAQNFAQLKPQTGALSALSPFSPHRKLPLRFFRFCNSVVRNLHLFKSPTLPSSCVVASLLLFTGGELARLRDALACWRLAEPRNAPIPCNIERKRKRERQMRREGGHITTRIQDPCTRHKKKEQAQAGQARRRWRCAGTAGTRGQRKAGIDIGPARGDPARVRARVIQKTAHLRRAGALISGLTAESVRRKNGGNNPQLHTSKPSTTPA
jgi:hypothetical protein